jgi:hypothetical protein
MIPQQMVVAEVGVMRRRRNGRLGLNHDNLLTAVAALDNRRCANREYHNAAASPIAMMVPRNGADGYTLWRRRHQEALWRTGRILVWYLEEQLIRS